MDDQHPITAVEIPQWAIDLHDTRKRLFMKIVEPVIVFLLGPVDANNGNDGLGLHDYHRYHHDFDIGGMEGNVYNDYHYHQHHSHPYSIFNQNHHHQQQQQQQHDIIPPLLHPQPILSDQDPRRRLNFLPNYIENVSAFRETSMSFATLTMLFTTMSCVLIVFLSCFYHNQKTSPLFISPRRHRLPRLVPPPLPVDGTFSWIKVCFYISDEEVRIFIGL